ncbi:MAG TPA: cell division protein FtsX, partial [Ruminococcaceae bacterium]|nr:cell division protein FtsX [Oscillospiraceae bacterium]
SDKDNINTILYTVVGILSLIIMAGSVSLIYNAFTISIGERSREYGMLSSVGSTPRQIRNSVFFEALVISAIGIPLGILAGVFGVGVTIQLIKPLMNDLFVGEMEFGLVVSPYGIIIAAALAVVTIFISAYIPARRAGKMTAIEAIRQAKDIKLKAKKVKTSGIIRRIFGFEGELATKQLKRSRRRYRTTIISLCISIILFMTVTSFTGVLQRSSEIYYSEVNFDIQCQLPLKHEQSQEFINDVLSLDGIEDYSIGRYIDSGISLAPDKLTGKAKEVMGNYIDNNGDYLAFFRLVSLSPQGFEKYLDELGLDAADYMDVQNPKGILINTVQAFSSDQQKYVDYEFLSVGAGEPFDLNMEIDVSDADTEDRLSQRVTVGALTDKLPLGLTHAADYIGGVNLVVSDEVMDELREKLSPDAEFGTVAVCLTSEDSKTLAGEIDRLRDNYSIPDIMVTDIESILQAQQNLVLLISVFTYGFIALITLIGITNVFNTISTNISLRRKEFAMLKSVGMTPGGFSRMICLESIFYGVRALLFGLPLGLGFGYLVYMAVTSAMDFPYSFPLYNLLICVAAVFLIVFSTMAYSFAKVKKENIIDALRQDT